MQVHRGSVEIVIQTPAKLNLFFEVLGKRADGYHEIETLMCPISLCDTLYFRGTSSEGLDLECSWGLAFQGGSGFDDVPRDGNNLVWRAIELLRRRTGTRHGATPAHQANSHSRRAGRRVQRRGGRTGGRQFGMEAGSPARGVDRPGGGTGQRRALFPPARSGRVSRPRRANRTVRRIGVVELCGRSAARRPGDGRRVWRLSSAGVAADRAAVVGRPPPRKLTSLGPTAVQPAAIGCGANVAVDRPAGSADGRRRLLGPRHERQRNGLFRAVSQRAAGAEGRAAAACPPVGFCRGRAKLCQR